MAQQQMTEEQVKALQEKLKKMSPEELKEFQKQQCIFCQIASGKVQSRKVYEGEKVMAILDINPANPGHVLIFPKEHYQIMPLVPDDEIGLLFGAVKHISQACLKAFKCQGTTIFAANGMAAGQKAQHFMVHLIPRMDNDDLQQLNLEEGEAEKAELSAAYSKLKKRANQLLGIEVKDEKEEELPQRAEEKAEKPMKKEARAGKKKKVVDADFKEEKANLDSITDLLSGRA